MSFRVGDRVRVNTNRYMGRPQSRGTGTVVRITTIGPYEGGAVVETTQRLNYYEHELTLIGEGDSMSERALREGDRVRILPNPDRRSASNGCSWNYLMDEWVGQEFVLRITNDDNWMYQTWCWAPEWLELVTEGEPMEPKYNPGDKLLFATDIPVEVIKWVADINQYQVKSLITHIGTFECPERRLRPMTEKALAKRLEKAGAA